MLDVMFVVSVSRISVVVLLQQGQYSRGFVLDALKNTPVIVSEHKTIVYKRSELASLAHSFYTYMYHQIN